jgi:hypothetical protein
MDIAKYIIPFLFFFVPLVYLKQYKFNKLFIIFDFNLSFDIMSNIISHNIHIDSF